MLRVVLMERRWEKHSVESWADMMVVVLDSMMADWLVFQPAAKRVEMRGNLTGHLMAAPSEQR